MKINVDRSILRWFYLSSDDSEKNYNNFLLSIRVLVGDGETSRIALIRVVNERLGRRVGRSNVVYLQRCV